MATTVLAIAHTLALQPEHTDLGSCRFHVHLAHKCQPLIGRLGAALWCER